jgi:hypothetical protein
MAFISLHSATEGIGKTLQLLLGVKLSYAIEGRLPQLREVARKVLASEDSVS